MYLYADHNDDGSVDVDVETFGDSTTCRFYPQLTINYRDANGHANSVHTGSGSSVVSDDMSVDHAYAPITTSSRVFFANCDSTRSATCEFTLTANPK